MFVQTVDNAGENQEKGATKRKRESKILTEIIVHLSHKILNGII